MCSRTCRLDAIAAIAVVDDVDVHHEDVIFAVLTLDLRGDVHLAHLALDGDVVHLVEQDGIAHELLGDGRGAFGGAAGGGVDDDGTGNADGVDAAMLVEALVLGCDRSLEHVIDDLVLRNLDAIFEIELCEDRLAVIRVDGRDARVRVRTDGAVIGQAYEPGRAYHAGKDNHQAKCSGDTSKNGEEID